MNLNLIWNYYWNISIIVSILSLVCWVIWFLYYIIKKPIMGAESPSIMMSFFLTFSIPVLNLLALIGFTLSILFERIQSFYHNS